MALDRRFVRKPVKCEHTKEDDEHFECLWKALCETGSACVTNPSDMDINKAFDILKQDPGLINYSVGG